MIELFVTLIIIFGFICLLTVFIGIKSRHKIYPIVSACCCVMIITFAVCSAVEISDADSETKDNTKAYVTAAPKIVQPSDKADKKTDGQDDSQRIVYITKTGRKYHYSYDCSDTDFYECTLAQAIEMGLEPCGNCVE